MDDDMAYLYRELFRAVHAYLDAQHGSHEAFVLAGEIAAAHDAIAERL